MQAAEAPAPKKEKKVEIAKSSLVYEVKPLEAGQDMIEMGNRVRAIELDGLVWGGEFKIVDVAYGIQKLIVACVIEDEKVSLEDFEEKILAMGDIVSSVDLINMNKVCAACVWWWARAGPSAMNTVFLPCTFLPSV